MNATVRDVTNVNSRQGTEVPQRVLLEATDVPSIT